MNERPILMSAPMVRATLAGIKTQTRRVIQPQPSVEWSPVVGRYHPTVVKGEEEQPGPEVFGASDDREGRVCRYGEPGSRLWVRESFAPSDFGKNGYLYRADGDLTVIRWTPSIHMPRKACRIVLDVTGVRVERLQSISQQDAEAEGVKCDMSARTFRDHYRVLWDSLNETRGYSWQTNPWVWVVEFKPSCR